jgi:hypothetical protein
LTTRAANLPNECQQDHFTGRRDPALFAFWSPLSRRQ